MPTRKRAAFLDRDGTLTRPAPPGKYICKPSELELLDGVVEALGLLRDAGYACVVISNQRGVALGHLGEDDLRAIDSRLHELLELERSYYCIHGLEADCACRKPRPGLLFQAAAELDLDLENSLMIGDSDSDLEAGRRAGCRAIKVSPADGSLLAAVSSIAGADRLGHAARAGGSGDLGRF